MIARERDARRLAEARRQPVLPFTSVDVPRLLDAVRREHFPDLAPIPIVFVAPKPRAPLACIVNAGLRDARIYLHAILNDARCPEHVFSLIAKHELAHAVVRPKVIDGRRIDHPPEFWELEGRLAPEREAAWEWIEAELLYVLDFDERREGVYVRTSWRRDERTRVRALRSDLGSLSACTSRSNGPGFL